MKTYPLSNWDDSLAKSQESQVLTPSTNTPKSISVTGDPKRPIRGENTGSRSSTLVESVNEAVATSGAIVRRRASLDSLFDGDVDISPKSMSGLSPDASTRLPAIPTTTTDLYIVSSPSDIDETKRERPIANRLPVYEEDEESSLTDCDSIEILNSPPPGFKTKNSVVPTQDVSRGRMDSPPLSLNQRFLSPSEISPPRRKQVLSHVLVPPLKKELRKEDYEPRPHSKPKPSKGVTVHSNLRDALDMAWQTNELVDADILSPRDVATKLHKPHFTTSSSIGQIGRKSIPSSSTKPRSSKAPSVPLNARDSQQHLSSTRLGTPEIPMDVDLQRKLSTSESVSTILPPFSSSSLLIQSIQTSRPPIPPKRQSSNAPSAQPKKKPRIQPGSRLPPLSQRPGRPRGTRKILTNEEPSFSPLHMLLNTRHVHDDCFNLEDVLTAFLAKNKRDVPLPSTYTLAPVLHPEDDSDMSIYHIVPDPPKFQGPTRNSVAGAQGSSASVNDTPFHHDSTAIANRTASFLQAPGQSSPGAPPRVNLHDALLEQRSAKRRRAAQKAQLQAGERSGVGPASSSQSQSVPPSSEPDQSQTELSLKALGKRKAVDPPDTLSPATAPTTHSPILSRHPNLHNDQPFLNGLLRHVPASNAFLPGPPPATPFVGSASHPLGPYRNAGAAEVLLSSVVDISPTVCLNESLGASEIHLGVGRMVGRDESPAFAPTASIGGGASTPFDVGLDEASTFKSTSYESWPLGEEFPVQTIDPTLLLPGMPADVYVGEEEEEEQEDYVVPANFGSPTQGNVRSRSTILAPADNVDALSPLSTRSSSPDITLKHAAKSGKKFKARQRPPSLPSLDFEQEPLIDAAALDDSDDASWHGDEFAPIANRKTKRTRKVPLRQADNALSVSPPASVSKSVSVSGPGSGPASAVPASSASAGVKPDPQAFRNAWATGNTLSFCHQCRRKTDKLKMNCQVCPKRYCNRCIALRYPDLQFAKAFSETNPCPSCSGHCNCDVCCRKRGDQFVSLRRPISAAQNEPRVHLPRVPRSKSKLVYASGSTLPSNETTTTAQAPPFPKADHVMPGPVSVWGPVYGLDGKLIATGYSVIRRRDDDDGTGSSLRDKEEEEPLVIYAHRIEEQEGRKKRLFVGKVSRSWNLGRDVKVTSLDPRAEALVKRKGSGPGARAKKRIYVGKREVLFLPVEKRKKAAARVVFDVEDDDDEGEHDWEREEERVEHDPLGFSFASSPLSSLTDSESETGDGAAEGDTTADSGHYRVIDQVGVEGEGADGGNREVGGDGGADSGQAYAGSQSRYRDGELGHVELDHADRGTERVYGAPIISFEERDAVRVMLLAFGAYHRACVNEGLGGEGEPKGSPEAAEA